MSGPYQQWLQMQPIEPKSYACQKLDRDFELDGRLDKPEWQGIPWTEDFADIEGDAQPRPRYRSRAKMRWTEKFWYFAAELEEPCIWAKLREKNSVIFYDNDFEIFIDPDSDNCNYYEFEMNALNTIWELNLPAPYKDRGSPISPYNLEGLRSAVHIQGKLNDASSESQFWSLEVAIPWEGLKSFHQFSSKASSGCPQIGEYWRVNFSRVEWDLDPDKLAAGEIAKLEARPEHNWVWSPQGVIDMHRPERWGYAYFVAEGREECPPRAEREILKEAALELYYLQSQALEDAGKYLSELEIKAKLSPASAAQFERLYLSSGPSGPCYTAVFRKPNSNRSLMIRHNSQIIY